MIRIASNNDIEAILEIWLSASIKAHSFIEPSFWQSQVENMRSIYLPSSEVYVYEDEKALLGFYAIHGETLAAIFVKPSHQGTGIGKKLIKHAEQQRDTLLLTVYKENEASIKFYLKCGFECIGEQIDENTGREELMMRKVIE